MASKLKRTMYELYMGSKAYLPKKKKEKVETTRTKEVKGGLAAAGIDWEKDKPSARLRRKK